MECVSETVFVEYGKGERKKKEKKMTKSQNKGRKVHVQLYSLHNVSLESNARGAHEECA